MDKATSSTLIIDIYEYFQYTKMPSDTQIDQWHEKIKFIPVEPVEWIRNAITDQDRIPRNLPKEIIRQWYAYRKAHKSKTLPEYHEYCEDCHGHGTHMFKKLEYSYEKPIWIEYIANYPCNCLFLRPPR